MRALVIALGVGVAALSVLVLAYLAAGIRPMALLDDATIAARVPWYTGAFSAAGNLVWAAGATAAGLCAVLARGHQPREAAFLGWFAGLTLVVVLDDQYTLHERVLPAALGLPEFVFVMVHVVLVAVIAIRFGSWVVRHPQRMELAVAVGLLDASLALDILKPPIPARPSLEEAFKFLGILCWATFAARAGIGAVRRSMACPPV